MRLPSATVTSVYWRSTSSVQFLFLLCVCAVLGCSKSEPPESIPAETSADESTDKSATTSVDTWTTTPTDPWNTRNDDLSTPQLPAAEELPPLVKSRDSNQNALPASKLDVTSPQLRADLTPDQLNAFLAGADKDMQMIASGRTAITDQQKALAEMQRIVKLKLEASRRLRDHPNANDQAKQDAMRGELQSLSHLAALGDVKSAVELEALANTNLDSDDPNLVFDSRLVLIGFAIESLQNGKADAAEKIVRLIEGLGNTDSSDSPGIAALMVMGQARQMLVQYNYTDEAARVRQLILARFAKATDPQVAKMAAQFAGTNEYDQIEVMLQKAIDGESLTVDEWKTAMQNLVRQLPDLQTVQYLAGAALQFEGLEQPDLASATYEQLADSFSDPIPATGKEAQLAIQARQSRQDAIGKTFDPDLDTLAGPAINMSNYRGKIVLMPFWAITFPESLQLIPGLEELVKQSPESLAIVGMNLDPKDAPVLEFVKQNQMSFPSYRSESSATNEVANEVAARFGMVSAPFIVVIDQKGMVASIDYTQPQIIKTINALSKNSDEPQ